MAEEEIRFMVNGARVGELVALLGTTLDEQIDAKPPKERPGEQYCQMLALLYFVRSGLANLDSESVRLFHEAFAQSLPPLAQTGEATTLRAVPAPATPAQVQSPPLPYRR